MSVMQKFWLSVSFLILASFLFAPRSAKSDFAAKTARMIHGKAGESSLDFHEATPWTQMGPEGVLLVRAFMKESSCPLLQVGKNQIAMQPRGTANADFPKVICEGRLGSDVTDAQIDGKRLPLPKGNINKILFIGDTGCQIKMKNGKVVAQKCNQKRHWPFAQIAQSAADWHPDLVVHVGDYHYREAPCPADNPDCAGATSGDNLQSWQEDFFRPAAPLLAAAPWVFVRGNHEICARGAKGWFRLLDPHSLADVCVDRTNPYWITLGDRKIAVLDAAEETNILPSLKALQPPSSEAIAWLFLHRPFLTSGADDEGAGLGADVPSGEIGTFASLFSAVFVGHRHHFSLNQFSDERPPELINGNGGAKLDGFFAGDPKSLVRDHGGFGFMTLERTDAAKWLLVEHEPDGKAVFQCSFKETPGKKAVLDCNQ